MPAPRIRGIAAGAILAAATLAAPSAVRAQDTAQVAEATPAPGAAAVEQDRLVAYAAIYTETAELAREFYAELARTFESQRKATLREEMDDSLSAVRERHGMTPEEYKQITYFISVDQPTRDAFDVLVKPPEAEPGG